MPDFPFPIKEVYCEGHTPCECDEAYFQALRDWVRLAAAFGWLEKVRKVALSYLSRVKSLEDTVIMIDSVRICPHGQLTMLGAELPLEYCKRHETLNIAWLNNVPLVYTLFRWFNGDTIHRICLESAAEWVAYEETILDYEASSGLFKRKDFKCLQDPVAVAQMMQDGSRTVESVVSDVRVVTIF
ncbi:hypothetical protein BDV32DRAFT_144169 [Aspergillus pseudonomiae]|uniref:Uncharacterized protein n=1 Tax=Aspergillus pseudonomiae TaxID=1506151 RepID=A0A5N6IGT2_9EURO|nr:uncharacterized protein BDV37DRAFT_281529 [Aspergillus pseudonomiae]KAB8265648.1 hypothetical protein BDV32DRAFT_144169 [Aspergillus pseudonomiae]KAE8405694.1 hypothetical protein BDV37DRAFT_281529 [Aspergillus pseudonomiae]